MNHIHPKRIADSITSAFEKLTNEDVAFILSELLDYRTLSELLVTCTVRLALKESNTTQEDS